MIATMMYFYLLYYNCSGWDFAITDEGLYFIEVNSMCSYSKYVHEITPFYAFDECDTYLRSRDCLSEATSTPASVSTGSVSATL